MLEIFKKYFKRHYYLLTAVLMFLAYPSFENSIFQLFPLFAWVCLVPIFLYVRDKSLKRVYQVSFVTGLLGFLMTNGWMGAFGGATPSGFFVIISLLIPILAFFFSAKIFLAEFFSQRYKKYQIIFYVGSWLLIDFIKSIGLLAFPWNYLGYTQYPLTSMIQISSYTGVFGVTFLIVTANYLIAELIYKKSVNQFPVFKFDYKHVICNAKYLLLPVLIIANLGYGYLKSPGGVQIEPRSDLKVAIAQTCISPWDNWDLNKHFFLNDILEVSKEALDKAKKREPADLLIWSESATLEYISYRYMIAKPNRFVKRVLDFAKNENISILTGEVGVITDHLVEKSYPQNSAALINNYGEVVETYAKIHLCPFGEWMPYEKWMPTIAEIARSMGGSNFYPGLEPKLFSVKSHKFGVLICYEGMFFKLNREYKKKGAKFLVNITNDGWTKYHIGHMQHFAAAKFRAIENGVWFVRAGNTGYTTIINPYGEIIKSIPILTKDYLIGNLDFNLNYDTFYTKYGDFFLYTVIIFMIIVLTFCEVVRHYNINRFKGDIE
jgi:apolipoprotein N-acyltransferase